MDNDGTSEAPMISYVDSDGQWVALKGGRFNINGSAITPVRMFAW